MIKLSISLLLLSPLFALSQLQKIEVPESIEVGQVKRLGTLSMKLTYAVEDADTTYHLIYRDATYKHTVNFEGVLFSEVGGTADALYQALKDGIKAKKGTKTSFSIGEDRMTIITDQIMGMKGVLVLILSKGFFTINDKEIDKLFGKNSSRS